MNIPNFDLHGLWTLYLRKDFTKVSHQIVEIIKYFDNTCHIQLTREEQSYWDECVFTVMGILTQPDFNIPADYAFIFININHLLVNMVMASSFGSMLPFLKRVYHQNNNYIKILICSTCHTPSDVETDALFDPNQDLASLWWFNYQTAACGTLTQEVHDRVIKHLKVVPERFKLYDLRSAPLYFQSTYFSPETDRQIKTEINRNLKMKLAGAKITNNPRPKSIAIICDRWQPTTAVYKSSYHQLKKLSEKYELTLVDYSEEKRKQTDLSLFKHVKKVQIQPDLKRLDFTEIKHNDFQLAYFPDIGMNYESVCLSNMKVAPIMVTGYGHPVSTFGSKVDYFIGGIDSELPELADTNYSERLVLIPGIGAHPVFPNYTRTYPKSDKLVINCCWTAPKINFPMLEALRKIQQQANKSVYYQFFPSWTVSRYQSAIPFIKGINDLFGSTATVHLDTPYQKYLSLLESAQFSLDSYPFGGYNTVVDSLFVGCPVITIEGTRFFNRAASALMRKVGVTDLISHSIEEYIANAVELVNNQERLRDAREAIAAKDLRTLLVDNDEPKHFADAIDYIIENHETLKTGTGPVILA